MPTPQDLKRLQALLAQLGALGAVRRGELIRAEDWNSLVAAVTDVARTVLAVDVAPTVPAHEHLDQVTSAWLAPQLREVFERGPLADPAMQHRLLDLEQGLRRLSAQLDESRSRVDEFRGRLTDVITRDLEREAAVTRVRREVDNVIDPRPDLLDLRNTLATVQGDLGRVLQAAAQLTVAGEVVDLGSVVNRLGQLEQFRERLRLADGALLDAATVEQRLAQVTNSAVSPGQLEEALRDRPAGVPAEALAAIEGRLGTSLRAQVNQALDAAAAQIRDDVNDRLNSVGDLVDSRVNDALPGLTRGVINDLAASLDAAREDAINAALAGAAQALDAREQAIRDDLGGLIDDVRAGLAPAVSKELARQLPAQFDGLRSDLSDLSRRLDAVAAQAVRHEAILNQHELILARLPQDQVATKNDLRQTLLAEIDLRDAAARRTIDDRFAAFDTAQGVRLAGLAQDLRKQAADTALKVATDAANGQGRDLRAQLLAEMRAVAREEVGAAIRDSVRSTVNDVVKEQLVLINRMTPGDVGRVIPTVPR
jgi:hypothetical protein